MKWKAITLILLLSTVCIAESTTTENAELDLPITREKLVIAHFMPAGVFYDGAQVPDNILPLNASSDGPAKRIGGLVQAVPMSGILRPEVSLEEMAAHEIRAAKLAGLDWWA